MFHKNPINLGAPSLKINPTKKRCQDLATKKCHQLPVSKLQWLRQVAWSHQRLHGRSQHLQQVLWASEFMGPKSGDFVVFGTIHESSRFVWKTISTEVRDFSTSAGKKHENSALPLLVCSLCPVNMSALYTAFAICLHIFDKTSCEWVVCFGHDPIWPSNMRTLTTMVLQDFDL